jgi:hypothetical protein
MALDDDLKSAAFGSSTPKILKIRVNRRIVHFNSTNDNKNPELFLQYSSTHPLNLASYTGNNPSRPIVLHRRRKKLKSASGVHDDAHHHSPTAPHQSWRHQQSNTVARTTSS